NAILSLAAIAAVACGNSTATTSPSAAPPASAATVVVATNSKLGQILVDGSGRTLYLFEADKGMSSTCYSACAQYWPPLLTNGAPKAGAGATASLLGTTMRTDGTTEVTYGGHPVLRGDRSQSRGCHRARGQQLRGPVGRRRAR